MTSFQIEEFDHAENIGARWSFYVDGFDIILSSCELLSRQSRRHKWRRAEVYSRCLDARGSLKISEVPRLSDERVKQALADALAVKWESR